MQSQSRTDPRPQNAASVICFATHRQARAPRWLPINDNHPDVVVENAQPRPLVLASDHSVVVAKRRDLPVWRGTQGWAAVMASTAASIAATLLLTGLL